jgi:hypothetical protein
VLVVLSHSKADVANRRNQILFLPWEYKRRKRWGPTAADLASLDAERPSNPFEIIPPGGAWTLHFPMTFQVHTPSPDGTGSELLGKTAYFQLDLDHRYIPDNIESYLRAKWNSYGLLWAGETRTQPIELKIPKSPHASQCPPNLMIF